MAIDMEPYSRFSKTDSVLFDGNETFGMWKNPITDVIYNNLILYVVDSRHVGRPDIIADELYGNSSLDWVLIAVNNATTSLNWPNAGDTIKVPDASLITSELL